MSQSKQRRAAQPAWQIEIKSVEAEFWKLFSSNDPLHLSARLQGTATGTLESPGATPSEYWISFEVKIGFHNYEDEDDVIRMGRFRVKEVPAVVLRATDGECLSDTLLEAFKVDAIAEPICEALSRYLNERFADKPPKELLPGFDIDDWLAKHRQSELRMPPQDDDDEADWWKRGEAPPN